MESITIKLHDGEGSTQRITVNVMDPIKIIQNYIPAGGCRWILFQGSLILGGFSFKYHGIKDDDDLYIVRPKCSLKSSHNARNHGLLSTRRSTSRKRIFGKFHDVDPLLREVSRLSDLTDRRLLIQTPPLEILDDQTSVQLPNDLKTILDETAVSDGPNTEPLPIY
jgi:hypothetical protein